jgi:hypothetical protein
MYQNGEKYIKCPQKYQMAIKNTNMSTKIPIGHKVDQIFHKSTKWPQNIPIMAI